MLEQGGQRVCTHIFKVKYELISLSMSSHYSRSLYWLGLETEHPDRHSQIHQLQLMNPQEVSHPGKHSIAFKSSIQF